jgi:histidine triad (HIT) family protein
MFLDGNYDDNNAFAKILRGEAPSINVYEDAEVLAFMDTFPRAAGHVPVMSKTSTARTILEVDPATLQKLIVVVQKLTTAISTALRPDGAIIAQLNGRAAGQTVDHFHFHIIPQRAGEPMKAQGERAAPDRLRRIAREIIQALPAPVSATPPE